MNDPLEEVEAAVSEKQLLFGHADRSEAVEDRALEMRFDRERRVAIEPADVELTQRAGKTGRGVGLEDTGGTVDEGLEGLRGLAGAGRTLEHIGVAGIAAQDVADGGTVIRPFRRHLAEWLGRAARIAHAAASRASSSAARTSPGMSSGSSAASSNTDVGSIRMRSVSATVSTGVAPGSNVKTVKGGS